MRAMLVGVVLWVLAGPVWATEYTFGNDQGWGGTLKTWGSLSDPSLTTWMEYGLGDPSLDPFSVVYYDGFRGWLCEENVCESLERVPVNYEDHIYIFMSNSGLPESIFIDGTWNYEIGFIHYLGEVEFTGALTPVTDVPLNPPVVSGAPGPVLGSALPGAVFALLTGGLMMRRREAGL